MSFLALALLLPLSAPAPQDDSADPEAGWERLDYVVVQAGDRVITRMDLQAHAQRARLRQGIPITTQEQLDELLGLSLQALVVQALEAQAGEDHERTPDADHRIERWLAEQRRQTALVDYVEQLEEAGVSAHQEEEANKAEIYAINFRRQGLGGPRPTRDDYVRPGEIREVHRTQGDRLLGEPPSYRLQDLVVTVEQAGGEEAARELAGELRERLLAGEDFGELHDEYGSTELRTRGVTGVFGPSNPLPHAELRRFCEAGEVGDVSPVVAVPSSRRPGRVAAFRVVRIFEKTAGTPAPSFEEPRAQEQLRTVIQDRRNEVWLEAARARLRRQAYLWTAGSDEPDPEEPPSAGGDAPAPRG